MLEADVSDPVQGVGEQKILREVTFLPAFWVSCGRIWTKIGGSRADAFPDLPIQPKTLDLHKKTKSIKKNTSEKNRRNIFHPEYCLISLTK